MNSLAISSYGLNAQQFNSLFSENFEEGALDALEKSASAGNLDSIDMLHNIALRNDPHGKKAESILFDLFSGKTHGNAEVANDIQEASFQLYQTARLTKPENGDFHKLRNPSKLLYMAGAAATAVDTKRELSRLLTENGPMNLLAEKDLWAVNRMLTTDEIHAYLQAMAQKDEKWTVHYPIPLTAAESGENTLNQMILESIMHDSFLKKSEIFPINTGNHWIILGIHDNGFGIRQAFAFNSHHDLSADTREKLMEAASTAGANGIEFVEKDMQDNVPNGCGLFASMAIQIIMENGHNNPVELLKNFSEDFLQNTLEQQEEFNVQQRRQMYSHSLP